MTRLNNLGPFLRVVPRRIPGRCNAPHPDYPNQFCDKYVGEDGTHDGMHSSPENLVPGDPARFWQQEGRA